MSPVIQHGPRRSPALPIACAIVTSLLLHTTADAGDEVEGPNKRVAAVRAEHAPHIDGLLTEEIWQLAEPDSRFTQSSPDKGAAPSERTEVRVAYDDRALYVAVRSYDREPDKIRARLSRRDRDIETDWVALYIDSRHDHASADIFQLSAAGVQVDGQVFNDGTFTLDWDAVWKGEVHRDADGWSAEFEIPLTVLRYTDADVQEWGFQVYRRISRKGEILSWAHIPSDVSGFVVNFGQISELRGLESMRTLELRPYLATTASLFSPEAGAADADLDGDFSWRAGLSAKVGLTSNLSLDAAIKPDFGQLEADQLTLNLTRFETFFPEKRPFFLEGREIFETPISLFYSRRIGQLPGNLAAGSTIVDRDGAPHTIAEAPAAAEILGAAKLTGRIADRVAIGALTAVTGGEDASLEDMAPAVELSATRSHSAARLRLDNGRGAHIGALATASVRLDGDDHDAYANHDAFAEAIDAFWEAPAGQWRLTTQLFSSQRVGGARTQTTDGRPCPMEGDPTCVPIARADGTHLGPGDVGYGGHAEATAFARRWYLNARYHAYSALADINALGYGTQWDVHGARVDAGYRQASPQGPFNNYSFGPVADVAYTIDGLRRTSSAGLDAVLVFKNFTTVSAKANADLPDTWDTVETFDDAALERAAAIGGNVFVRSDERKRVVASVNLSGRREAGAPGRDAGVEGQLQWQVRDNVDLSLEPSVSWSLNALRFYDCSAAGACLDEPGVRQYLFAELDAASASVTLRGSYTMSPRLSLQLYGQLFAARGEYSGYATVDTAGRNPRIRRDSLMPSIFDGDGDGDGTKDDDFENAQLNLNAVLRWEPWPGSEVFLVYSRQQQGVSFDHQGRPQLDVAGIKGGASENHFLTKFVYYWGRGW